MFIQLHKLKEIGKKEIQLSGRLWCILVFSFAGRYSRGLYWEPGVASAREGRQKLRYRIRREIYSNG